MSDGVNVTVALRDGRMVHGVLSYKGGEPLYESSMGAGFIKWLTEDGAIVVRCDDIAAVLYGERAWLRPTPRVEQNDPEAS